jgi:GR25 family glycosyltransferase involved in LPS biosynthesis
MNNMSKKINNFLDCIDIIYWINLERSEDRRKNMSNILDKINIHNERINAFDGKSLSDEQVYSRFENYNIKSHTKIEFACLLSHLETIRKFSESNYEIALIFEDDLSLEYVKFWKKSICNIIKNAPQDWEIIMLNYVSLNELKQDYTFNTNGYISCLQAYLINNKSAKKFINQIYKNNKYVLDKNKYQTADNYIYGSLKTYAYKYPYFTYSNENDSTIHSHHIAFHNYTKMIAFNAWKELYNLNNINDKINNNLISSFFINLLNIYDWFSVIIFVSLIILSVFIYYIIMNKKIK